MIKQIFKNNINIWINLGAFSVVMETLLISNKVYHSQKTSAVYCVALILLEVAP